VRIHALGYSSLFINQTFGRGLIPDTFHHYKKQRLRWTIGPIQQIKSHWHLYLPQPWATPSKLTPWQKLIESSHSLGGLRPALVVLGLPITLATMGSLIHHQEIIPIPPILWIMALILIPVGVAHLWLMFYLLGCRSIKMMISALIMTTSLSYIRLLGAFKALIFWKALPWHRTHKFKISPSRSTALSATRIEICLAGLYLGLGIMTIPYASHSPLDLLFLVSLGFISQALVFLTAPYVALVAEDQLQKCQQTHLIQEHQALTKQL